VPDCEAKPPKNFDGFAPRAGGWGDSPRHGLSGNGPARVLAFSCQCFAGMRHLTWDLAQAARAQRRRGRRWGAERSSYCSALGHAAKNVGASGR
jgi:hypothetical protein